MCLETTNAVAAHDKPELERAEAAAKRDLPVAVVNDLAVVAVVVLKDVEVDTKRVDEPLAVLDPHRRAVKRRQHPLVRVEVERVEVLKRLGVVLILLEQQRRTSVRGVHMHPQLAGLAAVCALPQRLSNPFKVVNRAHVRSAQRGGHIERVQPASLEGVDLGNQRLACQTVAGFHVDRDGVEAHANHLGGLLCARVRAGAAKGDHLAADAPELFFLVLAVGHVGQHLVGELVSRSNHACEDGFASAAVEDAAAACRAVAKIAFGQGNRLGEPVHDNGLELSDRRTADPVEVCAVEGVGVHLGNVGGEAIAACKEGEEARVSPVG